MATEPREMEDLAKISGALLVNIGTLRGECLEGMKKGGILMIVTYVHFFPLILCRVLCQSVQEAHCL